MNIKNFKQQNPAYADVPDQELADALYRKHYAQTGMTRADFYQKVEVQITNPERVPQEGSDVLSVAQQVPAGIWRGLGHAKDAIGGIPVALANSYVNSFIAPQGRIIGDPEGALEDMTSGKGLQGNVDMRPMVSQALEPVLESAGGRQIDRALSSIGDRLGDAPEPRDAAERVAAKTGEYIGASLPFVAAPQVMGLAKPASYATAPVDAATVMGQVGQNMLKGTMQAPVRTAAVETGLSAVSGLGGGIGQEVGGDTGEMIGAIATPTGLSAAAFFSPTFMAGRLARTLAPTVSDKAATSRAREMVGQTLGEELPRYQQEVARSGEVERAVNEAAARSGSPDRMELSLAERTGSPALMAAQKDLDERITGPTLEAARKRRDAQDRAIDTFAETQAPVSSLSSEAVAARAQVRSKAIADKLQREQAQKRAEREVLAGNVPSVDLVQAGQNMRAALNDTRRAVRDHFNQRAIAEGLNTADVTLDFRGFQQRVADTYAPRTFDNPSYRPKVLDAIVRYGAEDAARQPVRFQDVKALRERIVDDLNVSQKSSNPADRMQESTLSRLLRDFDDMIVNTELRTSDQNLAERWNAFRKDYRDQVIETFRQPDVRSFGARDNEGFRKLSDEAMASDLWKPNNVTGLRSFTKALQGMDPASSEYVRGVEALESVALDSLRKAAVRDGVIDPARYSAWVRQHDSMLSEMPYLRSLVEDVGSTDRLLLARQQTLADRARVVERNVLERKLASVEAGAKSADSLIDEAVRNPGLAMKLRSRVRDDKAALDGLRAAVWQRIPFDDPRSTITFLDKNQKALGLIFSAEHLRNARFIADARAMADRLPKPGGAAPQQVPFRAAEDALGMKLPQIGTRLYAIQSGRVGKIYPAMEGAMNFVRGRTKRQMDDLWQKALFDPEVAKDLAATMQNPDPLTLRKLAAKTFKFGVGIEPDRPNAWTAGAALGAVEDREQSVLNPTDYSVGRRRAAGMPDGAVPVDATKLTDAQRHMLGIKNYTSTPLPIAKAPFPSADPEAAAARFNDAQRRLMEVIP
ncbi:hypothetical protein [Emcibacter sp. SYSU 3D8]|uniref:hypothetical protein n=1 Tax=Emcibacter sp. SYSU 3D8 TaxID=3133969 RepID=UPI0031FEAA17